MRTAFFDTLQRLAAADPRIELIVGDLGFRVVDEFEQAFPGRFINAGVAEQNMTGLAAGLALCGSTVFTYSIANFPTLRCLEQVRNDVCYHGLDVKIVAVGGGLAYGQLGFSHHATEDLAVMRAMPNLLVAAPNDPLEVVSVTEELVRHPGPAYLRLGKTGEPTVHDHAPALPPGTSLQVRPGDDVALVATGGMLPMALEAAELLARKRVEARVVSMPWLVPFDETAARAAALQTALVVTVEEHSVVGGLGGAAAEVLAETSGAAPLVRIGLPPAFTSVVGDQAYLQRMHGLDGPSVAQRVLTALKEHG